MSLGTMAFSSAAAKANIVVLLPHSYGASSSPQNRITIDRCFFPRRFGRDLLILSPDSRQITTTTTLSSPSLLLHKCCSITTPPKSSSHHSSITAHTIIPDYTPEANFYKVEAVLRPWRVPQVSSALLKMGIRGVTVSDVRGFGAQGGLTERQAGSEFSEDNFVAKVKMEIVVSKNQVDAVIEKIIEEARTGEIGDGKIFVVPVADVIRVRTGERGEKAERMMGGLADMFSATDSPAT